MTYVGDVEPEIEFLDVDLMMNRYFRPSVLLMGRPDDQLEPVCRELRAEGFEVQTCAGPGSTFCPVLRGGRCAVREMVDAMIAFIDGRNQTVDLPKLTCAAQGSDSVVLALEAKMSPPTVTGARAMVGAMQPPQVIADTVRMVQRG